jgi:hypothetical protein
MTVAALVLATFVAVAPGSTLTDLLAELDAAERAADDDPVAGVLRLARVLDEFHRRAPEVAADPDARKARLVAQLTLSRALLAVGDDAAATLAMDETLRMARGAPLPAELFGPAIEALARERERALSLGQRGKLEITCLVPCRAYVDEHEVDLVVDDLVPGAYRIWIEARDPLGPEPERTVIDPTERDGVAKITYPSDRASAPPSPSSEDASRAAPATPVTEHRPPAVEPREPKRLLPRWLEIAGMVLGGGGVAVGATFLGIDGKCVTSSCENVFSSMPAGIAALAAGGAVLVPSVVLFGVDEHRARNPRHAVRRLDAERAFRFPDAALFR